MAVSRSYSTPRMSVGWGERAGVESGLLSARGAMNQRAGVLWIQRSHEPDTPERSGRGQEWARITRGLTDLSSVLHCKVDIRPRYLHREVPMPWEERSLMDVRLRVVQDVHRLHSARERP